MKILNLDSYITLHNETIIFNLDTEIIEEFTDFSLEISPFLQTKLLSHFIHQKEHNFSLIFISHYYHKPVIKTLISHNITNYLYNDIVNKGELGRKINLTHQILIENVLEKMRISEELHLKENPNLNLISGIISGIIVIISIGLNLSKFLSLNPLFFLFPLLMGLLLQQGIKIIMKKYLIDFLQKSREEGRGKSDRN